MLYTWTRRLDMDSSTRRYYAELFGVLAVYGVVLMISVTALDRVTEGPLRIPIALAPMVPAMAMPVVVVRALKRMDELQRQIQLEALGFSFAGTAVITFGYGFLELVGFPRPSSFVVWPLMAVLWILGRFVAARRFQ